MKMTKIKLLILIITGILVLIILFWPKNIIHKPASDGLIVSEIITKEVDLTETFDVSTEYLDSEESPLINEPATDNQAADTSNQENLPTTDWQSDIPLNNSQSIDNNLILLTVPFTAQAPSGQWSDSRFQDACEEASAIMAIKWVQEESLSLTEATNLIEDISAHLLENYQEYRDSSAQDTIDWIFKDYFNYQAVSLQTITEAQELIDILASGRLIIAPMNGQALGNPFFTPPGPDRHMLVIRGYNFDTQEFITNDPGTRQGEAWAYPAKNFLSAIRDYPSGYKKEIKGIEKNIIVIEK